MRQVLPVPLGRGAKVFRRSLVVSGIPSPSVRKRTRFVADSAGVDNGTQLRLSQEGQPGANGGPPGDLYVVLKVAEHPVFDRRKSDLYCLVPINVAQAALGDEIEIPTLEQPHKLKIPEGTRTGAEFRIRHKGVPHVNSHGCGDLVVQVEVTTPTKLTREQKRLFEQLRETLPTDNKPNEKGLFEKVKDYFM